MHSDDDGRAARPPRLRQVLGEPPVAGGVPEERNRFGSVLDGDLAHPSCDVVECLFPGRLAELPFAPGPGADQGGLEAVRVVEERDARLAASTEHALALGICGVAVDLVHDTVDRLDHDPAAPRTHVAVSVRGRDPASAIPRGRDTETTETVGEGLASRRHHGHGARAPGAEFEEHAPGDPRPWTHIVRATRDGFFCHATRRVHDR